MDISTAVTEEWKTTTEAQITRKTTRKPTKIREFIAEILANKSTVGLLIHVPVLTTIINSGGLSRNDLVVLFIF